MKIPFLNPHTHLSKYLLHKTRTIKQKQQYRQNYQVYQNISHNPKHKNIK